MYELYALFPFEQVEKNSRVIIYGAGRAGLNFWRQAGESGYCQIICLVDKDEKKHNSAVKGIEKLKKTEDYDYVVISQINFAVRRRIKDDLVSMGVPENKIVMPQDNNLMYWSLDGMMQNTIDGIKEQDADFIKTDARKLVSADRLDIGIKWLLIRDIINNTDNPANKSLYTRHIMAWTHGKEGFMPTSGRIKDGVEEYIREAKKLVTNIKENGFDKAYAVPVSSDNEPLDGVHRIASCIEADVPIWIKRCPGLKPDIKTYKWYMDNGFVTDDMLRIYRAFCDLYQGNYGIAVLFGPAMDLWDYLLKQMENQFKVVGYVDLDFESNYMAYETLINEMYFYKWEYQNDDIDHKISLLKLAPLKLRVVVLSDENLNGEDLFGKMKDFKMHMRDATFFDFNDIELQIHASDNQIEANHLAKVFLSPNNLKVIRHRFKNSFRKEFIKNLVTIKKTAMEAEVSLDDIVVVNSMVLEALGIRNAKDIDIVCMPDKRTMLMEKGLETWALFYSAEDVKRFINDDNNYFIFNGLKFLNLEFVKEKKEKHDREKDKNDIRLIDLYNEMIMVYDEREKLKEGIFEEIKRRRIN